MTVCPSCGSTRIRNDYKPAPFALRLMGIRALLCDHCNHQFRAFSPAPPKNSAMHQTRRKADVFNPAPEVDLNQLDQHYESNHEQPSRIRLDPFAKTAKSEPPVPGELIISIRQDLRTEITKLYEQSQREIPGQNESQQMLSPIPSLVCPDCNSPDIKQRHRSGFERAVFSITDHKAFTCRSCGAMFYLKLEEEERMHMQ